jgi:Bacterial capsule synthesis protein PGA_cap
VTSAPAPHRRKLPRATTWVCLVAAAGLVATGCGSGSSSPTVAAAPTTKATTAKPTTTPAKAPTTTPAPAAKQTPTASPPSASTAPPPSLSPSPEATSAPASTTPSVAATSAAPRPITLAFGGDVHFEGVDASRLAADPATAMGPIATVLQGADLAMVNLETAITTRGTAAVKKYVFRAPPTAFTALRSAGVDVVTMANNHGEDYGPVGLQDTLAAANAAHFPVVGIGQDADAAYAPYEVTLKGERVAIIGATQVLDASLAYAWSAGPDRPGLASAYNVPRLLAAVRAARAVSDTVVVYLHWGHEMSTCPTGAQRDIAQQLVAAGADIVVGAHAHVQLGAGRLGSGFVDYGLGNFVFYVGGGLVGRSGVLLLTVTGRHVTAARWVPAQIEGGVPVPLSGAAASAGLDEWNALRTCSGLAPLG